MAGKVSQSQQSRKQNDSKLSRRKHRVSSRISGSQAQASSEGQRFQEPWQETAVLRGSDHKNDQAHSEQKNWSVVRNTVGYARFITPEERDLLNNIYFNLHFWLNFFQPVMKLVHKETRGLKTKNIYDGPLSPFRRVLALVRISEDLNLPELTTKIRANLINRYSLLDPIDFWEKGNQLTAGILKISR